MSKLLLIGLFVGLLFVLESECKVYGNLDAYDEHSNYGHVLNGGNHVVPVVNKVVDYYSKPQYAFGYEVDDYYNQLSHGRWEIRDGDVTQGQYRVLLPDGRIQIVSYIADKGGYRPTVTYIGKGHHPPPPPAYAQIKHLPPPPPPPPQHHIQIQPVHEYVPGPTPIPVLQTIDQGPYGHQPPPPPELIGSPYKLDLSPHQLNLGPVPLQHGNPGAYGGDLLIYGPSSHHGETIKLTPARFAKKRELLYDRTLFRTDVPMKKRLIKRKIHRISTTTTIPTTTPATPTTGAAPIAFIKA